MNKNRYEALEKRGIINWCWGKWGTDISKILEHNIVLFPEFQANKLSKLLYDLKLEWCWPHDVRFYNWGGLFTYIYANYKLAYDIYMLFWWTKLWIGLLIFVLTFSVVTIWWYKYFNWCLPWNRKNISLK